MAIEEVIDRAVQTNQEIEIEYCTRAGNVFTCRIADIRYSSYYGGMYIQALRLDINEEQGIWSYHFMCSIILLSASLL